MSDIRRGQEVRVNNIVYVVRTVKTVIIRNKLTMIIDMEES